MNSCIDIIYSFDIVAISFRYSFETHVYIYIYVCVDRVLDVVL